ncbi:MAG: glycosyltransferase [Flavobacteriales bacterium]
MTERAASDRVLVLASYPPRVCGIATYTQDLVTALNRTLDGPLRYTVCALEDGKVPRDYPTEVTHTLDTKDAADHIRLALEVDQDPRIVGVWVQHEFGLYQGGDGQFLLQFLSALEKPVAVTFHTVLPSPSPDHIAMIRALALRAADVVVLTERSARILREEYTIDADRITVIPHGTHVVAWHDKDKMKAKYGLTGRRVLSTFGLLSSNKSIETALDALLAIKEAVPDVLYLILGRTHPEVVRQEGERYREMLIEKVNVLGLTDHVRFVDRYLELDELLEHLQLTDIYLFTSKDPEQAVSGTFAYAMGCGCPVVSTRIPHAQEVLDDGTGVLIDFNDPGQLATATTALLLDEARMDRLGRNALQRMRATAWDNVAIAHARTFARRTGTTEELSFQWPPVSLMHLTRMTDDIGMVQFCDISDPDVGSGHTLDDNARALIALCYHARNEGGVGGVRKLMVRYLDYIEHCQLVDGGFLNYADASGAFTAQNHGENLEDSNGRAVWALGVCVAHEALLPEGLSTKAESILIASLEHMDGLNSPRAIAFAMKGMRAYASVRRSAIISGSIDRSAMKLMAAYKAASKEGWDWFEPKLTYGNAVLPEAILLAYEETKRPEYREVALATFRFLLDHLFEGDMLRVISNRTWKEPGVAHDLYGEQPIDVAYTIAALASFHEAFGDLEYARRMHLAFEWFLGRNHLAQVMYNTASGGCYDGLEEHSVNLNQGAESTVCYLLARCIMERMQLEARSTGQERMLPVLHRTVRHTPAPWVASAAAPHAA